MGTTYSVKFTTPEEGSVDTAKLFRQIDETLEQVNREMSTYDPDSELSRFNQSSAREWFKVSTNLVEVIELSQDISIKTGGAFDVTVGPLVNLWGFGPDGRPQQVPSKSAVAAAKALVGMDKLEVDQGEKALRKSQDDLYVDLSAIAKGHGVDRVAELLEASRVENYFVEVGGEIRVRGRKLDGSAWRVGIEKPIVDRRELLCVVELQDLALATSGNYRNFYWVDGQRFAHTIDPRSGSPVTDKIAQASVLAESCAVADGIATSMMSLGYDTGIDLANQHGWAVLLIAESQGKYEMVTSKKWDEILPHFADSLIVNQEQGSALSNDE